MVGLRKLLRNQVKKWNQTGQVPAWCSVKSWGCFQGLWEEVFYLTMLQNYPTCTAGLNSLSSWVHIYANDLHDAKYLVALSPRIFQWPLRRLWRKVFASARNLVRTVFWCISYRGIMIAVRLPWGLYVTVHMTGWLNPKFLAKFALIFWFLSGSPWKYQREWKAKGTAKESQSSTSWLLIPNVDS